MTDKCKPAKPTLAIVLDWLDFDKVMGIFCGLTILLFIANLGSCVMLTERQRHEREMERIKMQQVEVAEPTDQQSPNQSKG